MTLAVREGIIKHSRDYDAQSHPELAPYFLDQRPPLEAQIIDLADEIAYLTADIDDGIESEILHLEDVRSHVPLLERFFNELAMRHPHTLQKLLLQEALKCMLDAMAGDLIATTAARVRSAGVQNLAEVRACPQRLVAFSPEMETQRRQAKSYLFKNLYESPELLRDHQYGGTVIRELFQHWSQHPDQLPASHAARISEEGESRVIVDYIAGMTDVFCIQQWNAIRK